MNDLSMNRLGTASLATCVLFVIALLGCGPQDGVKHNPYAAPVNEPGVDQPPEADVNSTDPAPTDER